MKRIFLSLAFLPFFFTMGLVFLFNKSLFDYIPNAGDGLGYWAQIAGFVQAGFHTGYYGWGEMIAPIDFFRFSVHGPVFTIIVGTLARFLGGWHWYSPPLYNLGFLTAALLVYVYSDVGKKKVGLQILLVATTWSLFGFNLSPLQETFHASLGIVIATLISLSLIMPKSLYLRAWVIGLIFTASLMRPTWSILFFPVTFLYLFEGPNKKRYCGLRWLTLIIALVSPVIFFQIWRLISAPLAPGYGPLTWIQSELTLPIQAGHIKNIIKRLLEFAQRLFDVKKIKDQSIYYIVVWQSIVMFSVIAASLLKSAFKRKNPSDSHWEWLGLWILGINLFNAIFVYGVAADSQCRLLLGPLFMSVIFLLCSKRSWAKPFVFSLIVSNLLISFQGVSYLKSSVTGELSIDRTHFIELKNELSQVIHFNAKNSGWCNTLLISDYNANIISIPPGIGLEWTPHTEWLHRPPKARYALVDQQVYSQLSQIGKFKKISTFGANSLYENLTAGCD